MTALDDDAAGRYLATLCDADAALTRRHVRDARAVVQVETHRYWPTCERIYPEVGHESEGYSCATHNMPWPCPHGAGEAFVWVTDGNGHVMREVAA